jgi:DNA-directed RNA polymerase subunit RPC12/RpoP
MRVYVSNDSFPELREVRPWWVRSRTWWRALAHAFRHRDFWQFVVIQVVIVAATVGLDRIAVGPVLSATASAFGHVVIFGVGLGIAAYLQVSLGGDMMRRHLRSVSASARYACPRCGQSLFGHAHEGDGPVRCPECAAEVDRRLFAPPYRVPAQFLMFPPWRDRAAVRSRDTRGTAGSRGSP